MKSKTDNELLDKAILLIFVLFLFVNVFSKAIGELFGGIGILSITYLLCLYFVFFYGKREVHTIKLRWFVLFIVIYVVELQLFWDAGSTYVSFGVPFKTTVWNLISFVPQTISAVLILTRSDDERKAWFRRCLLICLTVSAVATLVILQTDRNAVRLTATGHSNFYPFLADYGMIYGAAIILPFLLINSKGIMRKVIQYGAALIMAICIFNAAYTLAIIAAVVGIGCYCWLNISRRWIRYSVTILLLIILIALICTGLYEPVMSELASIIPIEQVSVRLTQIVQYIRSGKVQNTTYRIVLYMKSINAFLTHPVTGNVLWNPDTELSEHSTNLDILGACGIVVFAIYMRFVLSICQYHLRHAESVRMKAAIRASLICFFFVSTVNPIFATPEIFVLYLLGPLLVQSESIERA